MPNDRSQKKDARQSSVNKHEAELKLAAKNFIQLLRALLKNVYAIDPEDPMATELPVAQLRLSTLLGDGPLTVSSVAREMGISVSGVTQLAHRLEAAGLVARLAEDGDRRVRRLVLTRRGSEIVRRRSERRLQSARKLLAKMSPQEMQAALDCLQLLAKEAS